jgi:hypothetical protein
MMQKRSKVHALGHAERVAEGDLLDNAARTVQCDALSDVDGAAAGDALGDAGGEAEVSALDGAAEQPGAMHWVFAEGNSRGRFTRC